MKEEKMCEVVEIWRPVKEGGMAYDIGRKQNLELVAYLVNGYPIRLADGCVLERSQISEAEATRIKSAAS